MEKMEYKYVSEDNPYGFHEKEIKLDEIKPHPKNPRTIDNRSKMELNKSIKKFGLIDKPILNILPEPDGKFKYILLAGHQRTALEKQNGKVTLVCQVPEIPLSYEDELELLIRHNKNTGKFDMVKLAEFDPTKLMDFGFLQAELPKVVDELDAEVTDPVFPITPKFSEKHGYVMIIYDNEIDKANLETMLGIERVRDYKSSNISVGSVITFDQFKKKINGGNS